MEWQVEEEFFGFGFQVSIFGLSELISRKGAKHVLSTVEGIARGMR
jgi:hypothetical protein